MNKRTQGIEVVIESFGRKGSALPARSPSVLYLGARAIEEMLILSSI